MTSCACKRGIFALRACGNPAATACSSCSRPVCEEHLSQLRVVPTCVECVARSEEGKAVPEGPEVDYTRPDYAYSYRERFYGTSGYRPLYTAAAYDSYYDSYDVRSFDEDVALPAEAELDTGVDFMDS